MAEIFQIQAKDTLVRINQFDALNCVQNFNWDAAMNAENLTQLGDANYDAQTTEPEVSGSFEVRSTGSLCSMLSRMIYTLDGVTGEFEGPIGTANTALIRETDLERAVFDFIEAKKANEVFDRSIVIPRAALTQFSVSAQADGTATESFSFEGDLLEVFRKGKQDVVSLSCVRDTAGTPTTTVIAPVGFDLTTDAGAATATQHVVYALDIDGRRVKAADLVVTTDAGGDKVALSAGAIAKGITVPTGARVVVYAYKKLPGTVPTISYPTTARFVKGDKINIWLVSPASTFTVGAEVGKTVKQLITAGIDLNEIPFTDADLWLRLQSCDLSVDLAREALKEIRKNDRGNSTFYRAATYPLNCSVDISALERDHTEWAKLQGKTDADVLDLAGFENKEWMVIARYYLGDDALQTVGILNARVDAPGARIQAAGRSEVTWRLAGSEFVAQGAAV
jgi:hypothetical protein